MIELFSKPTHRYENPILTLRKKQLRDMDSIHPSMSIKQIFETLPKNVRKKFFYDKVYDKALDMCKGQMGNRMKECLQYCIEIIA